jgi:signal transduction histidine kinase
MMFTRIAKLYRDCEAEQLAVLRDPGLADQAPPGLRRWTTRRLARLSEIERPQLHDFCMRWPGRRFLLGVLAVVAVLALIGAGVHVINPAEPLLRSIMSIEMVGLLFASAALGLWFNYRVVSRHKVKAALILLVCSGAGALAGLGARAIAHGQPVAKVLAENGPEVLRVAGAGVALLLLVVLFVAALRNAAYEKLALQLSAEAAQERLARQLGETQLRLLRAQIEPHFLFNTLGAVQQLAERDGAGAAAELTANLIAFLRSTAGGMARETATLGEEFELARAYLHVMQARLGQRLSVELQLPPGLAGVTLPGMAVLTLAENAVKHGAEPSRKPTRITLSATRDDGQVRVRVADTGVGLSDTPAGGMGLQNLRDRLRLAFGSAAALQLYEHETGGVVAESALPVQEKEAA